MNAEEIANVIEGREYGSEVTEREQEIIKEHGMIVIFGASDDLIEFRGVINDEVDMYDGGHVFIDKNGLMPESECEEGSECPYHQKAYETFKEKAAKIDCKWSHEGFSWFIDTTIEHSSFVIMDGDDKYCHGIVIDSRDL